MKPITINLVGQYTDGYIYLGRLFLVDMEGTVYSMSMDSIIDSIHVKDAFSTLKMAFLRNDWLVNSQGRNFFDIPRQLENFKKTWNLLAMTEFSVDTGKIRVEKHFNIPNAPIFDIKAYNLRLYLGNQSGLYESQLLTQNDEFKCIFQPSKIFDARTTYLSAKAGELMVSSNSEGLFRGRVGTNSNKTIIRDKPIADKSIRTGWASYDVLNYESQNNFVYYMNEVGILDELPRTSYSANDESSVKKAITNFGVKEYSQKNLMPDYLKDADIRYSFNSSKFCFLLTSKNTLYRAAIVKKVQSVHLSSRLATTEDSFERVVKLKGKTKVISTALVPSGMIIETLSSVILTSVDVKPTVLHDYPIYSLKTFLSSKRFKNIVLVFHEYGVSIHSLFPVEL